MSQAYLACTFLQYR